jgi:hypothetical protein
LGVPFELALSNLEAAARVLYRNDGRVHAVGITRHADGYGFRVIRNSRKIVALAEAAAAFPTVQDIPVSYVDAPNGAHSLVKKIPPTGPGSPFAEPLVPEQQFFRPLVCGHQIQNFDDDAREGRPHQGFIIIGSIGCFVVLSGDETHSYLLSNNHVVAGENRGLKGHDRILQQGSTSFEQTQWAATLTNFVELKFSDAGATIADGNAVLNDIDAGIARVEPDVVAGNGYLPLRNLPAPKGTTPPQIGDRVLKVGRTTGPTRGKITQYPTIVGPVDYDGQSVWFRNTIEIEGEGGTMFSDRGDSGSAIIKESTSEVVGLLYAGNGEQTYACPIDAVLAQLACSIQTADGI